MARWHQLNSIRGRNRLVLTAVVLLVTFSIATWWNGSGRQVPSSGEPHANLDRPEELDLATLQDGVDGIPVLCYHYFRRGFAPVYLLRVLGAVVLNLPTLGAKEYWTIPSAEFERHLRYFRDHGISVLTLDEVAAANRTGTPLPRPAVVITIDDADASVYHLAFPLLREYGFRAHLFVPTAKVGKRWSGLEVCDWEQLRRMQESGVMIIDSHTHDLHWKIETEGEWEPVLWHPEYLPDPGGMGTVTRSSDSPAETGTRTGAVGGPLQLQRALAGPLNAVAKDLLTSRQALTDSVRREPHFLAWPYGFASDALDSIAAATGFLGTLSLRPAAWHEEEAPWHIGRFGITAKTTLDQLAKMFLPPHGDKLLAGRAP